MRQFSWLEMGLISYLGCRLHRGGACLSENCLYITRRDACVVNYISIVNCLISHSLKSWYCGLVHELRGEWERKQRLEMLSTGKRHYTSKFSFLLTVLRLLLHLLLLHSSMVLSVQLILWESIYTNLVEAGRSSCASPLVIWLDLNWLDLWYFREEAGSKCSLFHVEMLSPG